MWNSDSIVSDCRKKEERMIKMKKIIFVMLLFFMAPLLLLQSKAQAAEISLTAENFPDAVMLKAVKKADKDGNGILSQKEIDAVTELSVEDYNKNINLKNISLFTNLKKFAVSGKSIVNIDEIYQLSKCEELAVYDFTSIDSVDFSRLQSLKKLTAVFSSIKKLVINNANLEEALIRLTNVQNTEPLDLSGNTKLEKLTLQDRAYERVNLSGNNYVKTLELDAEFEKEMNITNVLNLKKISLPGFGTKERTAQLKISNCPKLDYVEVNYIKSLTSLELKNLPLLGGVSINAPKLKQLDLSPFTKLVGITVKSNSMTKLKLPKKAPVDNMLIVGTKVKTIDVRNYKKMKHCDIQMPKLKKINLTKNKKIEDLQISDCNQLKKLDLTKNTNIKELRLNGNGNLTTVKLAKKNKIKLLCIIEAKKLKKINIESLTKVQDISATGVKKIKKLNLSKLQKLYDFEWTNGSLKKIIWGKKKGHFVRIIVKRNKLSGKINLKKFGGLFYFHCNHNNYKEIIGGKYLVSLNCDYNKNLRKVDMRICSELDGFSAYGVKKAKIYLCYPDLHYGPYLDTKNVTYSKKY